MKRKMLARLMLCGLLTLVAQVGAAQANPLVGTPFDPVHAIFNFVWGGADDGNLPWPDRAEGMDRTLVRSTEPDKEQYGSPAPILHPVENPAAATGGEQVTDAPDRRFQPSSPWRSLLRLLR